MSSAGLCKQGNYEVRDEACTSGEWGEGGQGEQEWDGHRDTGRKGARETEARSRRGNGVLPCCVRPLERYDVEQKRRTVIQWKEKRDEGRDEGGCMLLETERPRDGRVEMSVGIGDSEHWWV